MHTICYAFNNHPNTKSTYRLTHFRKLSEKTRFCFAFSSGPEPVPLSRNGRQPAGRLMFRTLAGETVNSRVSYLRFCFIGMSQYQGGTVTCM